MKQQKEHKQLTSLVIRKINESEYQALEAFLYEAIFIPEGVEPPPFDIIYKPELQVYIDSFGKQNGDICFVAETDNALIGAAWVRIMDDYGHIDNETPSLAISMRREYRKHGIGTLLMKAMIKELRDQRYKRLSLSVQKANYAARWYQKLGFRIVSENEEEYIMLLDVQDGSNEYHLSK